MFFVVDCLYICYKCLEKDRYYCRNRLCSKWEYCVCRYNIYKGWMFKKYNIDINKSKKVSK